ncbi:unnamed protein product [Haemonchus placei]|uniref:Uncharacterized protein n=1 Tax=Haemonchus placei TaxID=6290 RepID=A0A0N4X101_HAEPC|nr:unnamed protein product [Haemonchus placei]
MNQNSQKPQTVWYIPWQPYFEQLHYQVERLHETLHSLLQKQHDLERRCTQLEFFVYALTLLAGLRQMENQRQNEEEEEEEEEEENFNEHE